MRYMQEPVQNYILISIFKFLLDFTSLQVKSCKQIQIYENEQRINFHSILILNCFSKFIVAEYSSGLGSVCFARST